MLQRTFSIWRRLVGGQPAAESSVATQEDRRLWVRYPADLETNVQVSGESDGKFAGQVCDLSRGGARLLVERPVPAGQMIRLELPYAAQDARREVLACVVRVAAVGGEWSLGCIFSRELSEEDLRNFGADKVRADTEDQRGWKRFPTQQEVRWQKADAPDSCFQNAQVTNISASGIGLLLRAEMETGVLLTLELLGRGGRVVRTILACVVHVTSHPGGDWSLGCNFIRQLEEADLQELV